MWDSPKRRVVLRLAGLLLVTAARVPTPAAAGNSPTGAKAAGRDFFQHTPPRMRDEKGRHSNSTDFGESLFVPRGPMSARSSRPA